MCDADGEDMLRCHHMEAVGLPVSPRDVGSFLLKLFKLADKCHKAREWCGQAIEQTSAAMDKKLIEGDFGQASIENLPTLHGRSRRRRIDKDMSVAIAQAVVDRRFRSSSRMSVAGSVDIARAGARSADSQLIVDYQLAVQKVGSEQSQVQVSLDASVIGGEDTIFFAAWWPGAHLGAWLAPQVRVVKLGAHKLRVVHQRGVAFTSFCMSRCGGGSEAGGG